jgi:Spy/CpxP family protein refolding chaperone
MKIKTLIYSVLLFAVCIPWHAAFAQSTDAAPQPPANSEQSAPAKPKRTVNPESIKRGKLTRLKHDVSLTDEQAEKAKPLIDTYVDAVQSIKADATLDSRTKRQKLSEARQHYDSDLNGVLNPDQQQKLASLKEDRREKLRNARAGKSDSTSEPAAPGETQAVAH